MLFTGNHALNDADHGECYVGRKVGQVKTHTSQVRRRLTIPLRSFDLKLHKLIKNMPCHPCRLRGHVI